MVDCYVKVAGFFNDSEGDLTYHSEFYKAVINRSHLDSLKSKHGDPPNLDIILNQKLSENEKKILETSTSSKIILRSQNKSFEKDLCIICQKKSR